MSLKSFLKVVLNWTQVFMCGCNILKNPTKNSKIAVFGFHTVCISIVFGKLSLAKIKVSSKCFVVYPTKIISENSKVTVFINIS